MKPIDVDLRDVQEIPKRCLMDEIELNGGFSDGCAILAEQALLQCRICRLTCEYGESQTGEKFARVSTARGECTGEPRHAD